MTATDELRRLLDERGVEYTVIHGYREYIWEFGGSGIARASAIGTKGLVQMIVTGITPAQAIAATLGSGTCHYEIAFFGDGKAWFACSECGGMTSADYDPPKYCPHCGRKVVGE